MGADPTRDPEWIAAARKAIQAVADELARNHHLTQSDKEDLTSELTLHLITKAPQYDRARGAPSTWADRISRVRVQEILRSRRRLKRAGEQLARSLEAPISPSAGPKTTETRTLKDGLSADDAGRRLGTVATDPAVQERLNREVDDIVGTMPRELQEVCTALKRFSPAAAAGVLGISRRQLTHARERIETIFRDAGVGPP